MGWATATSRGSGAIGFHKPTINEQTHAAATRTTNQRRRRRTKIRA
ncbi:hypothetical protein OAE57_01540 [Synechococcus sp. AH-551-C10]|nr:hypothetical protein [Synechococcus sp. AH-551-C10]MDB4659733.1 hypothetical protein [Synechococcus sp. AH-551-C10]